MYEVGELLCGIKSFYMITKACGRVKGKKNDWF